MRNSWISNLIVILLLFPLAMAQDAPKPSSDESAEEMMALAKQVKPLIRSLRAFRPDDALAGLKKAQIPQGLKDFFFGWAYHQRGEYEEAAKYLQRVDKQDLAGDTYFTNRLEELRRTSKELKAFTEYQTENFTIRYREGRDKLMLFFLPEKLEQIYKSYSQLFNYQRDEKIIVELMPNYKLFSFASALTRKQIETTGTIALCVENRLVVLTPRRVAMGYYWPDVIAHEFVHYILTKQSHDRVPLWMQEGTAKYYEARWEDNQRPHLGPAMETAMAYAIEKDSLLSVEQMMPSFAALPTAALARQAYAQTTTMIDYLGQLKGEHALQRIITGLRDEEGDMDAVMSQELGQDFAAFEAAWRVWLKEQNFRKHAVSEAMGVQLLEQDMPEEKVANLKEQDKLEKKYVRLGDLLLERNRYRGALKEYQKIDTSKGKLSRQLVLRMITCLSQLDQPAEMISLLDEHIPDLETDVTMLIYKARARMTLEQATKAEALLLRAVRINPFNPSIYRLMLTLKDGETEAGRNYKEALQLLTNTPSTTDPERKS